MSKAAVAGAGTCPGLGWSLFVEGQSRSGQPGQEHKAELRKDLWCPGSLATDSCPKAGPVCSAPGAPLTPSWLLEFLPRLLLPFREGQAGSCAPRGLSDTCGLDFTCLSTGKGGPASFYHIRSSWVEAELFCKCGAPAHCWRLGQDRRTCVQGRVWGNGLPGRAPRTGSVRRHSTLADSRCLLITPSWA